MVLVALPEKNIPKKTQKNFLFLGFNIQDNVVTCGNR